MNIAICGSFSVGKTTLANALMERLSLVYAVSLGKEIALSMIAAGFLMSKDITEYGIVNYTGKALINIKSRSGDIYLSDRSLLDLYAYLLTNNSSKIRPAYVDLVKQVLFYESSQFHKYIYIPIEFGIENGNSRPQDNEYRKEVDSRILQLLHDFHCDYLEVRGTVEERCEQVIKVIKEWLKNE